MMEVEVLPSELSVDHWQGFHAFVNNSKEVQEIHDSKFDVHESSLLLNVGGQDAINLLHDNEFFGDDLLKFQLILSKLEKLYLLRLVSIYDKYKLSLGSEIKIDLPSEKSFAIQSSIGDNHVTKESEFSNEQFLEKEFEPLSQERGSFDLKVSPQAAVIHTEIKTTEDLSQEEDELRKEYHQTLGLIKAETKEQETDNLNLSLTGERVTGYSSVENNLNLSLSDRVTGYSSVEKHSTDKSKMLNQDDTSVRRSSRQIRISSRYADSKETIQHLLKPRNVANDDQVILEPSCTCSVCKKDFSDSKKLLSHWKSHRQNKKKKKGLPLMCKVCERSFAHYSQLKIHFKGHLSNEKCKKPGSLSKVVKKSDLNKKLSGKIDSGSDQDVNPRKEQEKQHNRADEDEMKGEDGEETIFSCGRCNHICSNKNDLENHIMSCENNKDTSEFKSLSNIVTVEPSKHKGLLNSKATQYKKRSYRNIGKYQCNYCKKHFKYERHLDLHITSHTGEKPNICEVCGKGFRLRRSLASHMRCHDESSRIKCEHCPKTFGDKRALESHKLVHSGVKPYSCGVCGKEFRRVLGLRNHCRLHQTDEAIKCDICDKRFVDKWGMLKHKTIHTGEKPFICSDCGKMFRLKKGLMDHMKLHNKESQLKCSLCPRTFVQQRKLDLHLKAHRGEKSFICDICGKGFMNAMNLKVHNRCHTGEKPYHCSFCDRTFNQQGSLIAHERHHKGERPYVCSICNDSFITKSQLTIHTRKHFNDRPYKCNNCDYAAYTGSLLKIHNLKHSTEKPYKCLLCSSAFKRQHHLDVHSRTHLANNDDNGSCCSIQIHKCPYCEESFDCEDLLSSHLTTHEIVVVTTETATGDIFSDQGPEEVAYNIVLL